MCILNMPQAGQALEAPRNPRAARAFAPSLRNRSLPPIPPHPSSLSSLPSRYGQQVRLNTTKYGSDRLNMAKKPPKNIFIPARTAPGQQTRFARPMVSAIRTAILRSFVILATSSAQTPLPKGIVGIVVALSLLPLLPPVQRFGCGSAALRNPRSVA